MTEYLLKKGNEMLIGRRARFKQDPRYTKKCWGKTGIIMQHEGVEHVGLSLKFDTPLDNNTGWQMDTCYIAPGSIELLE